MISAPYVRGVILLALLGFPPGALLAADGLTEMSMGLGYRMDSLDWNISGENNPAGSDPNILSELEWRDLDIFQFAAQARHISREGITLRGNVAYGWVLDGINRDSDYAGSNRSLEFSRSVNAVEGSRMLDLSAGIGHRFLLGASGRLRLIPMLGYSYRSQKLQMNNGYQVLWNSANAVMFNPGLAGSRPLGPFAGLYSSYTAQWSGPWVGTDFIWTLRGGSTLFARAEAHWVQYSAEANWNLRTVANDPTSALQQPVSFEHWADGRGWVLEMGWRNPLPFHHWAWGVSLTLQRWQTSAGLDRVYGANPAPPCNGNCFSETQLNEVNWSSRSINITLQKSFAD